MERRPSTVLCDTADARADEMADDERTEELLEAAEIGDVAAVRRLLAAGVDVNAKDRWGGTALFRAVMWDDCAAVVQLLLRDGVLLAVGVCW